MMGQLAYLRGYMGAVATSVNPRAGNWYQPVKGDTPWAIAKAAYQDQGLTTVKTGLYLLNDNPANSHIKKAKKGWETYKIKGLQLTPNYAADSTTATHGSGKSYPLLWVPPINGATPDEMIGKGQKGDPGTPGKPGGKGDPGPMPSNAAIIKLISDYMDDHPLPPLKIDAGQIAAMVADYLKAHPFPVPQISIEQISEAIKNYLSSNPLPTVTPSQIAKAVADFLAANPIPAVSAADIAAAVQNYLQKNPIARGEPGRPGEPGPPGPVPSDSRITKLIGDYMEAHPIPVPSGGTSAPAFDMATARDFVDARIRMAVRDCKKSGGHDSLGGGNANMWPGLIAAGIFGGAIVVALGQRKMRRA